MATIYSHSLLETSVCDARFLDAMLPRYGKAGPARQGQAGHALAERYAKHLFEVQRDSDVEFAERVWSEMRGRLSATDERALDGAVARFIKDTTMPWIVGATDFMAEAKVFVTVPDRRVVDAERVHALEGPVFRVTMDMAWRGMPITTAPDEGKVLHLLDWKWHRVVEHVAAPDTNRQLLRYAAALRADDDDFVMASLGFPRHLYYESDVFDREVLERAWHELVVTPIEVAEQRLAKINREAPDKTVGSHCRTCDLRRGCDAALRYPYELVTIGSPSTTEKATAMLLARALAADYAREVKGEIDAGEAVDDEEIEGEIRTYENLAFSRESLQRVLGEHVGPEAIESCLRATKTRVEDVLKAAGVKKALREELLAELRGAGDTDRKVNTKLAVGTKKKPRRANEGAGEDEGSA
jgi:hypothetical protein